MIEINTIQCSPIYRVRNLPVIFITALLGLFPSSCSDNTAPPAEVDSDTSPRLTIKIANEFQDEFLNPVSRSAGNSREDLIGEVFLYVFKGEEPVRVRDVRYENGIVSATLPPLSGTFSLIVIANESPVHSPASKTELLASMARTRISSGGIPPTGMPMGSGEIPFRISSGGETRVTVSLERCHSVLYVETPGGENRNYRVTLTGEQQLSGAFVSGQSVLASPTTNNKEETQSLPLSALATREAVAYYYPTDGEITITVQPLNIGLPAQKIALTRRQALLRNKKYILQITPGSTDGNVRSKNSLTKAGAPEIRLLEEF